MIELWFTHYVNLECKAHFNCFLSIIGKFKKKRELDEISTLAEFKGDHMFLSCLTCLRSINPQSVETFPQVLPRGMSAKVNVTSEMANVIKNAGYKAELSYHQILYPSAVESRKILMWLLDAMPKKTVSAEDSSGGSFFKKSFHKSNFFFLLFYFL